MYTLTRTFRVSFSSALVYHFESQTSSGYDKYQAVSRTNVHGMIFLNWICPSCFSSYFQPKSFPLGLPNIQFVRLARKVQICIPPWRNGRASRSQGRQHQIRIQGASMTQVSFEKRKHVSNMVSISHLCLLSSWHSKLERKMFLGMESCNHRCQGVWWSTTVSQNTQLS